MKNVVQDLTSAGLLGVWGKWMKHAKYIYNIQDFNPEQVLAVGYTKSKLITDLEMGLLAVVIAFTAFINISTFHIANYTLGKDITLTGRMGAYMSLPRAASAFLR